MHSLRKYRGGCVIQFFSSTGSQFNLKLCGLLNRTALFWLHCKGFVNGYYQSKISKNNTTPHCKITQRIILQTKLNCSTDSRFVLYLLCNSLIPELCKLNSPGFN